MNIYTQLEANSLIINDADTTPTNRTTDHINLAIGHLATRYMSSLEYTRLCIGS